MTSVRAREDVRGDTESRAEAGILSVKWRRAQRVLDARSDLVYEL